MNVLFVDGAANGAAPLACDLFKQLMGSKLKVSCATIDTESIDDLARTLVDVVVTVDNQAADRVLHLGGNPTVIHWDITAQSVDVQRRQIAAEIKNHLPRLQNIINDAAHAASLHLEPGISTCIFRPNRFDPAVHMPLIAAAGFKCIDLNCAASTRDFPWDKPAQVAELHRVSRDTGVAVFSVHAECGLGASSGTRTEPQAIDSCKKFADIAAQLSAVSVTIHAGRASDELHASFAQLRDHVRHLPCRYAWENGVDRLTAQQHGDWIRTLDPAAFSFVLDTGHSHINGNTEAYLDACAGLFSNLHVNDNNAQKDQHKIPGQGTFPWHTLMSGLERCRYIGPIMLEVQDFDRQDQIATVLADLRASVDRIKQYAA